MNISIVSRLLTSPKRALHHLRTSQSVHGLLYHPQLAVLVHQPFLRDAPVARRYLRLLAPLDWLHFPDRDLTTDWGIPTVPYVAFVAAYLIKLDQQLVYMSNLRRYLVEHPVLTAAIGFPLPTTRRPPTSEMVDACLPTQRHFARILRRMPNSCLQWLLGDSVRLNREELASVTNDFGQVISMDTKHILAWVKENNPKQFVKDRFDKKKQPPGDPDCGLGCKRKRNQRTSREKAASSDTPPPTPRDYPQSPKGIPVGEYYWGYASGIVATKIFHWAEIALAEYTQPFNQPDVSYFFPLMGDTDQRLGFRPRFGSFDAGFDAFYVYEYFSRDGEPWQKAFAAVASAKRSPARKFDAAGLPLCAAGLPMPLKGTFVNRSSYFEHQCGRYACPLRYPELTAEACPVGDSHWEKKGCITTLPTSIGARLRHQIDRDSDLYKHIYQQRTATERINAQAEALGIERPKLRNGQAITNMNTLIYVLINLRALHRIRAKKAKLTTA